ncbi:hypothetical protein NQ317_015725 [Molorchus minor]|uniref:Uncharacterized protein n=1 Tax=Molorchus minor TaxID=1323400 RepID=A0ABQ9IYK1_9CUCU|nr:hypothetical protein NQ317_015725 [Molorchus minor]
MYSFTFLLTSFLLFGAFGKDIQHRNRRFVLGSYTSTVTEVSTVTSLIPSSCVQMDATLLPCRGVRFLNFPQFAANRRSANESVPESKLEQTLHTTQLGWGEYLGLYAPTVTVTDTKIAVTTVEDPRIVVTFAVKGCRPMELPNNLKRCPEEALPTIAIQDILATSTVGIVPSPTVQTTTENTKLINIDDANVASYPVNSIDETSDNLEGTARISDNLETVEATAPLSL